MSKSKVLGAYGLLCLFCILGYAPALDAPFYFDDHEEIVQNQGIRQLERGEGRILDALRESPTKTRPIANLSFIVNNHLGARSAKGYRVVNLALHLVTGFLIFLLVTRVGARYEPQPNPGKLQAIGLGTAALWLVHPVNTQTVIYVSQRMAGLAALFSVAFLLTMMTALNSFSRRQDDTDKPKGSRIQKARLAAKQRPARRLPWILLSGLFLISALGSKESAVGVPFLVGMATLLWSSRPLAKRLSVFGGAVAISFIAALLLMTARSASGPIETLTGLLTHPPTRPGVDGALATKILSAPALLLHYVSLVVLPHPNRFRLLYDGFPLSISLFQPLTMLSWAILLLTGLAIWVGARKKHSGVFGLLWFLVLVLPETLVPGNVIGAEHRMYLPVVGLFYFATRKVAGVQKIRGTWKGVLLLVVVALLTVCTAIRSSHWANPVGFWQREVENSPDSPIPLTNLSWTLATGGDLLSAENAVRKATQVAPHFGGAHTILGSILTQRGQHEEAVRELKRGVDLGTKGSMAEQNLAVALSATGKFSEALEWARKALDKNPRHVDSLNSMGAILLELRRCDEGILYLNEALRLGGGPEVLLNLGACSVVLGEHGKGIHYLQQGLLSRDEPFARLYLARAYLGIGDVEQARRIAGDLVRRFPEWKAARDLLLSTQ